MDGRLLQNKGVRRRDRKKRTMPGRSRRPRRAPWACVLRSYLADVSHDGPIDRHQEHLSGANKSKSMMIRTSTLKSARGTSFLRMGRESCGCFEGAVHFRAQKTRGNDGWLHAYILSVIGLTREASSFCPFRHHRIARSRDWRRPGSVWYDFAFVAVSSLVLEIGCLPGRAQIFKQRPGFRSLY